MNRDFPLAPTIFGDPAARKEKKAARQAARDYKKFQRQERKAVREGTRYEPKVTKRQQRKWAKNIGQ
jgi:type II secretory pathway pseudopilin PulG